MGTAHDLRATSPLDCHGKSPCYTESLTSKKRVSLACLETASPESVSQHRCGKTTIYLHHFPNRTPCHFHIHLSKTGRFFNHVESLRPWACCSCLSVIGQHPIDRWKVTQVKPSQVWASENHLLSCYLLSGKLPHNYGKSPFSMGQLTINHHFQ